MRSYGSAGVRATVPAPLIPAARHPRPTGARGKVLDLHKRPGNRRAQQVVQARWSGGPAPGSAEEPTRYLSADPVGLNGSGDQYGYVANPTRGVDVLGLVGCLTQMAKTGERASKQGFTWAGHEYQKHMMRGELPHLPSQKPAVMNQTGQNMLEDVLSDPLHSVFPITGKTNFPGGYHVVSNIISADGNGFVSAVFDSSDVFQYF